MYKSNNSGLNKLLLISITITAFLILVNYLYGYDGSDDNWIRGYQKTISGTIFVYHSPQHDQTTSLLVRSREPERVISWQTAPIPERFTCDTATFVWMFGIDVNTDSHSYDLYVNDRYMLSFKNPVDTMKRVWKIRGKRGSELIFRSTMVDKYGDLMGYAFLSLPAGDYPENRPLTIRIEGEQAGSRTWYMTFEFGFESRITINQEPAIVMKQGKEFQTVCVDIYHFGKETDAEVYSQGIKKRIRLGLGCNTIQLPVPVVKEKTDIPVEIVTGNRVSEKKIFTIEPVKKMTLYLLHHSHVDIGYTHTQPVVERIHWKNLDQALEMIEKTREYPNGSRFKWNVEAVWAVEGYLKRCDPTRREKLIEALRNGSIGLDAMFSNTLTGLCRPEELFHLFDAGRRLSEEYDIPLKAAMIIDIPGYTWGLVPAMARNGIKYLALGTNTGHRIGNILSAWSDRPFYWVSPSGEEKVLCWFAGRGYSWFHTGLGVEKLVNKLNEKAILDYVKDLQKSHYPYDMVIFHYCIVSDNGPLDPAISDKIRKWNEKYVTPRIVISTTSEAFSKFEDKFKDKIPSFSGDLTGYWEDGAASSAYETKINRNSAERLVQAEVLWTMADAEHFPYKKFEDGWRNILLFSEHTWGSWNSISDPDDSLTIDIWNIKKSFAARGQIISSELLNGAVQQKKKGRAVDVYNTTSWTRTDIVFLSESECRGYSAVRDEEGDVVLCQKMKSGGMVFLAENVPPLGAKRFYMVKSRDKFKNNIIVEKERLSNGIISLTIDGETGCIREFYHIRIDENLVDLTRHPGLNAYYYVNGRDPKKKETNGRVTIRVNENGPLIGSVSIHSDAPGCRNLTREIYIIDGMERVDIVNTIDKERIYKPEGVHFAFPFNIQAGVMRMNLSWAVMRPEYDQLPGSCKNYFSVQRWVDISNQRYGVVLASPDAPLFEVGDISTDATMFGWIERLGLSQTLFSYVMNNYWETNYCAAQEGRVSFRYSIKPHLMYNQSDAERFGIERSQPLIAVIANPDKELQGSLFTLNNRNVIVTSLRPSRDGEGLIIRLFNCGGKMERVSIEWKTFKPSDLFMSSPYEERGVHIPQTLDIPPYGIRTIRAER